MNLLTLSLAIASIAAQEPEPQSMGDLLHAEIRPDASLQAWVEHAGAVRELRLNRIVRRTSAPIRVEGSAGTRFVDRQAGNQFRGTLEGDPDSRAIAFYAGDKLHAFVIPGDGSAPWTLSPDRDREGTYRSMSMEESLWLSGAQECGVSEFHHDQENRLEQAPGQSFGGPSTSALTGSPTLVQVALDCDYEFFLWHGGSIADTAAFMEGTLLTCGLFFEIDLNVRFEASEIVVRDDPNAPNYPYTTSGPCSPCMIPFWSTYVGLPFQTVHLFSGKDNPNLTGAGILWALCNSEPYFNMRGFHDGDVGDNFAARVRIMSHELGHNLGSMHNIAGIMESESGFNGSPNTPPYRFDPIAIGEMQAYLATVEPGCLPGSTTASSIPQVSSILPSTTTIFGFDDLTILGTDLQNVVDVSVNDRDQDFDNFELVSETELFVPTQIDFLTDLGPQTVTVHGPSGSTSGTFELVAPATPEQEIQVQALFSSEPEVSWLASHESGWISVMMWSYSDATFPQGSLNLLQGASVVNVDVLDGMGLENFYWFPSAAGIPSGETIYLQLVTVDPATGARAASAVTEVLLELL